MQLLVSNKQTTSLLAQIAEKGAETQRGANTVLGPVTFPIFYSLLCLKVFWRSDKKERITEIEYVTKLQILLSSLAEASLSCHTLSQIVFQKSLMNVLSLLIPYQHCFVQSKPFEYQDVFSIPFMAQCAFFPTSWPYFETQWPTL